MKVHAAAILGPMLINERKPVNITPHAPANLPIIKSNGPIPARIAAKITTVFCISGDRFLNKSTILASASDSLVSTCSKLRFLAMLSPSTASDAVTLSLKLSKALDMPPFALSSFDKAPTLRSINSSELIPSSLIASAVVTPNSCCITRLNSGIRSLIWLRSSWVT